MISRLLISTHLTTQVEEAQRVISELGLSPTHPDLLWIEPKEGKRLGVEDAKLIREHFSLKPFSAPGRAVVVIRADSLTLDAQNSLLKSLEEPPESASFILTASSENNLLPTILSRCQITLVDPPSNSDQETKADLETVQKLIQTPLEKRFEIIEKYEDKDHLLESLAAYISHQLPQNPDLVKLADQILEAQDWNNHQGNTRAILEYLALNLP